MVLRKFFTGFTEITGIRNIRDVITPTIFKKPTKTQAIVGITAGTIALGGAPIVGRAALRTGKAFIPKTALGKIATGVSGLFGAGVLIASPKARRAVRAAPRRILGTGLGVGRQIEAGVPFSLRDVGKAAAGAGIAGAAVAGGLAVAGAIKGRAKKVKGVVERVPDVIAGTPSIVTTALEPLGPVVQPAVEVPVAVEAIPKPMKPVTIKNIFKPSVDVRFSKSKRFINQQNLIRA